MEGSGGTHGSFATTPLFLGRERGDEDPRSAALPFQMMHDLMAHLDVAVDDVAGVEVVQGVGHLSHQIGRHWLAHTIAGYLAHRPVWTRESGGEQGR